MDLTKESKDSSPGDGKDVFIDNTHTIDDIKKSYKEGFNVKFRAGDEFINLSPEDFVKLPKGVMLAYRIAEKETQGKLSRAITEMAEADTPRREFGYDVRVADAAEQLKVTNVRPGFRFAWVRAYDDEVEKKKRQGYVMAKYKDAKTFANDGTKAFHYVGSEDKPEMVGMLISEENWKFNEAQIKKASEQFREGIKQKTRAIVEQNRGPNAEFKYEEFEQKVMM